ncbi:MULTISPECIES: RNA polymerase sigma factor [unclassified Clostridium]|uniref:RNA polymerase sigma factor n=1 Tax=unclassified Clostridium TaxID=2614128 RepID=UPI0002983CCA|nr:MULTISPECIES: RNA polymerase sigma factor [unclassified Clostridium]EKQ57306.1 MAG: RNA polymerase sigma factor, sigma-70 family [Clostridium sp. Maddingley MBC34-26]
MDFEIIIDNYGRYIYNYALKLSCNPSVAEDIAQETLIQAWKNISQLKDVNAIKKWLTTICLNIFRMKMRKEQGITELSYEEILELEGEGKLLKSNEPLPEDYIIVDEAIKDLQNGCFLAMVRRLTLNQRIAFSLVDMFGLPIDEAAEILELSKSATKGLLYRARMNLDSFFSDHCNLLHVNNPCSCSAWIEFSMRRDNLQKEAKKMKLIEYIDYKEKKYKYNQEVRNKIKFLYERMPDRKPSENWYSNIIAALQNKYEI